MNNPKEIKQILSATLVAERYLGSPNRKMGNKLWYKSPFRNERTPSFIVNEKGFHDFGDGWHGDIIDFVGRYYNTDFKNSLKILTSDFNLPQSEEISSEMKQYLKRKREEEITIKKAIDKWFNKTFQQLCGKLKEWQKIINALKNTESEGLVIAYAKEQYLNYIIEIFIDASIDDKRKTELYKDRSEIECLK